MRGSAFIAFFGIATAISSSLVGCGDEDETEAPPAPKVTKSGEGESCGRTDDCDSGLICHANICVESVSTGGSGGTAPQIPLGEEGESCSRSADCQPNLGCFNQRCAAAPTGDGGMGNTPTRGQRGETCLLTSDCEEGLVCRPGGQTSAVGVCSEADTGIVPTGNVCGAECETADHCCELPIELHAMLGANSCAEIDDLLAGVDCDTTALVTDQNRCFARTAYCECEADAWECNQGACLYTATCSADGLVPGGCATLSRTGRPLVGVCDVDETELCQLPAVDPNCSDDDDCDGFAVTDDPADTCVAGECTCYVGNCYRRCAEDLDCRATRICDDANAVCIPEDTCTEDITCQRTLGDFRATCQEGTCTVPCETDLDCNTSLVGGALQRVCHEGMCQVIGCQGDVECGGTVLGARLFCTAPADAAGVAGAESAITD